MFINVHLIKKNYGVNNPFIADNYSFGWICFSFLFYENQSGDAQGLGSANYILTEEGIGRKVGGAYIRGEKKSGNTVWSISRF